MNIKFIDELTLDIYIKKELIDNIDFNKKENLEKDDVDCYNCYKNQVDMRIITIDTEFLYLVDDIPFNLFNKINVYIKNDNLYLKIKEDLTKLEMMELLEMSRVVYDK